MSVRPAALQRQSFQSWAHSATHWTLDSQRELWDLNPPYQRGSVWTEQQRRNLIKSLLLGVPIGAIIYNVRDHGARGGVYGAVIDGKQRIETIRAFFDSALTVPAHWFEDDELLGTWEGDVTFAGLNVKGQRRMMHLPMPSLEANVSGVAAEAAIFDLVNTAGTEQSEEHLAHVRFNIAAQATFAASDE